MKRLQPLALTAASADAYVLRCRPKFDQISEEERADFLSSIKRRAVNVSADEHELEAEFQFTFNEDGGVCPDKEFFLLTGDDYGEMWIDRSVGYFARANEEGIDFPDSPGIKLRPHSLLVETDDAQSRRRYKVVFEKNSDPRSKEYTFTIEGGTENIRTITWMHGSYSASWKNKRWTFAAAPAADLEPLLLAIIRFDEAIHLELMHYHQT